MTVSQEQIMNFQMPRVRHGELVAWYPTGTRSQAPEVAQVFRVSGRNVHLVTATKGVKEAVRHIDDPKLKLNSDQREMGAWDFTEAAKENAQRLEELEDEVRLMRRQISTLIAAQQKKQASPKKAGGGLRKYQSLRNRALELGIEFEGNPPTTWLEEQIAAKESPTAEEPSD